MAGLHEDRAPSVLKPLELSIPLPNIPHTNLHIHLTFLKTSLMVFLTTTTIGDSGVTTAAMGSFVYAMLDVSPASFTWESPLSGLRSYVHSVQILRR